MASRTVSKISRLSRLKASQLKHAAFLMGLPSTGSKPELERHIKTRVLEARPHGVQRILSVDMGIRNLAYCVVDVPKTSSMNDGKPGKDQLNVVVWKKRDLLLPDSHMAHDAEDAPDTTASNSMPGRRKRKSTTASTILKTAFTPSVLSGTAFDITRELVSHNPTTILIERQRFRSGGAAAIQEWTVRVNMLESMLWASLTTLRETNKAQGGSFPSLHEVSPARVASFWTAATSGLNLRPTEDFLAIGAGRTIPAGKVPRKKVEKKDKIDLVRTWVVGDGEVTLEFEGETAKMADGFGVTRKRDSANGKLDDLADCLLQAAAWARWEANTRDFERILGSTAEQES